MKKTFLAAFGALALVAGLAFSPAAIAADQAFDGNLRLLCADATASSNAATLNNKCGVISTEALTTAAGSEYTLTLTNSVVAASDQVLWSVANSSNTTGAPLARTAAAGAGSVVFIVRNACYSGGTGTGCTAAFNGTLLIKYTILKYGS